MAGPPPMPAPVPCTIFSTPAGKPISCATCANKYAVKGVTSDGFATTQLPKASAGAIFQLNK